MHPPIPIAALQNLRCGHCRKFVTSGPVHVTPDSSILCGRCIRVAKKSYRNHAFEALASTYRYPCYFWPKHCNKRLAWNESLAHEKNCLFQSSCNVFCSRPGTFFKSDRKLPDYSEIILEHVKEDHLDILKCVACEAYLSNVPVFVLVDGKNVCHRCVHSNGNPKHSIRNLAYETIATGFIFPCIYRFRGCTIRLKFGREMWAHEHECPYGQISKPSVVKKPSVKGVKERGVIETHSGHIWGTITPHSALFAPPKTKKNDGKIVTQELEEVMKKKNEGFDAQSMDSVMSKSTVESLGDNISRSTGDNISRASSRAISDNPKYTSSNNFLDDDYRLAGYEMNRLEKIRRSNDDLGLNYTPYTEVQPVPLPPGYNKAPNNSYYQDNVTRYNRNSGMEQYGHLAHYPPIFMNSANNNLTHSPSSNQPKRTESLRVGNADIISELKERNSKKLSSAKEENNPYTQCNNLQDIVQTHDEVFK